MLNPSISHPAYFPARPRRDADGIARARRQPARPPNLDAGAWRGRGGEGGDRCELGVMGGGGRKHEQQQEEEEEEEGEEEEDKEEEE